MCVEQNGPSPGQLITISMRREPLNQRADTEPEERSERGFAGQAERS